MAENVNGIVMQTDEAPLSDALALEAAIKWIGERGAAVGTWPHLMTALGARWLARAQYHLTVRLETELRGAPPAPDEKTAVRAMVKSIGAELLAASTALDDAAQNLKDGGHGFQASQAKQAATRARQMAAEVMRS